MIHFRVRYERLARRHVGHRRRTALVRAVWVGLLVALAWVAVFAVSGKFPHFAWLFAAPAVAVGAAVWGARASGTSLSRWLDRQFGLNELLVTAVEVDRRGARSELEARLLDDAAGTLARLKSESLAPRSTRREAETLVAVALVTAGLWLMGLSTHDSVPLQPLGDLVTSDGGGEGPGTGSGAGAWNQHGSGASDAMQSLAAQLADHASARGVASALSSGDPWSAARAARALADQSPDMSDRGRSDLADALHAAADAAESDNPGLSEALRRAGRALESPNRELAAPGVEQLASELGALAGQGAARGAGELVPRMESRPGPQAERLAVTPEADSIERDNSKGGAVLGGSVVSGTGSAGEAPPVAGGAQSFDAASTGPDALGYPWAMREALRRYFTRNDSGR